MPTDRSRARGLRLPTEGPPHEAISELLPISVKTAESIGNHEKSRRRLDRGLTRYCAARKTHCHRPCIVRSPGDTPCGATVSPLRPPPTSARLGRTAMSKTITKPKSWPAAFSTPPTPRSFQSRSGRAAGWCARFNGHKFLGRSDNAPACRRQPTPRSMRMRVQRLGRANTGFT